MRGGFEIAVNPDESLAIRLFGADGPGNRLVQVVRAERHGVTVALVGRLFTDDAEADTGEKSAQAVIDTYLHSSTDGLLELDGEFSLVLIDLHQRRLIVRRDPRGTFPLYWTVLAGRPVIGTSLRSLADRLPSREISEEYVARFLSFPYAFSELPETTTVWKRIQRVRPETMLAISFDGRASDIGRWSWTENVPDGSKLSFEEATSEFLRLLQRSIRKRIGTDRFGAHLSGGMDSSSIACMARELLSASNAQDSVPTCSLTYASRLLAGERKLMQEVVDGGRMDARLLPGDDALHFGWFDGELPLMDEPYAGLFEFASQRMMGRAAADAGVDVLLTGVGIEHSLESTRLEIAEQLRKGTMVAAWSTARRWAGAANVRTCSVFLQQGLIPALASILPCQLARSWMPRCFSDIARRAKLPAWISPEFLNRARMRTLAAQAAIAPFRTPFEENYTQFGLRTSTGNWGAWTFLVPEGIRLSHPFLDTDLVRFCLGIPGHYKEGPGCRKRLLREAMRGRLPESIRQRRFKRGFNDVFWRGLSQQLPRLKQLIARSSLFETGWIDRGRLESSLESVAMGVGDTPAGGRLASTLALIAWHEQHGIRCDLHVGRELQLNIQALGQGGRIKAVGRSIPASV
jgi:asparagine synthase (glutamine-hydrolysing)